MNDEVCLEVWGDFACFAPPYGKVERLTYPVPTPSAIYRGLFAFSEDWDEELLDPVIAQTEKLFRR